jgi:hypothetical protein
VRGVLAFCVSIAGIIRDSRFLPRRLWRRIAIVIALALHMALGVRQPAGRTGLAPRRAPAGGRPFPGCQATDILDERRNGRLADDSVSEKPWGAGCTTTCGVTQRFDSGALALVSFPRRLVLSRFTAENRRPLPTMMWPCRAIPSGRATSMDASGPKG